MAGNSMDSDVVARLFQALVTAHTQPDTFRIFTQGPRGVGEMVVLVMDSVAFDLKVKPVLDP